MREGVKKKQRRLRNSSGRMSEDAKRKGKRLKNSRGRLR
jgi:hypothetical protein